MIAFLRKSALVRLLIPFIFGIIGQYHLRWNISGVLAWSVAGLLAIVCVVALSIHHRFLWRHLFGVTLVAAAVWAGILFTSHRLDSVCWEISETPHHYRALLLDDPVAKAKTLQCKVRIVGIDDTCWNRVAGKAVIVYLPPSEQASRLQAGDGLEFEAVLKKPAMEADAGFDYPAFLEKAGFAAVGFPGKNPWRKCQVRSSWLDQLKFQAQKCRKQIVGQLKQIVPDRDNATVAMALSIGYKEELDPDLRRAFASTGTAHILAVSGLHLAMLYAILCFLFSPLERFRTSFYFSRTLILAILCGFAFVTGLAPSIVRAYIMVCFIAVGNMVNRRAMTINSLAASALFMLLYDPLYLFNIGFQLSYAAVISIVSIYPSLIKSIKINSLILSYFWELVCVSVSAQLGTAPLSLYYFRQFPLLFIFTNLYAIPLAGVLLLLIPLCVLLHLCNLLPGILAAGLNVVLDFFVSEIRGFGSLPFAVVNTGAMGVWEVLWMYTGIVLAGLLLLKKRAIYLYFLLSLVLFCIIYYF
ncbi:MAG: ComEC family competence protein [Dysgonamonadaceae bacterium]|jgi:competence protein ComEC|nr:ComEC family competence protein [Dysgonamonadaceae bacterium]